MKQPLGVPSRTEVLNSPFPAIPSPCAVMVALGKCWVPLEELSFVQREPLQPISCPISGSTASNGLSMGRDSVQICSHLGWMREHFRKYPLEISHFVVVRLGGNAFQLLLLPNPASCIPLQVYSPINSLCANPSVCFQGNHSETVACIHVGPQRNTWVSLFSTK